MKTGGVGGNSQGIGKISAAGQKDSFPTHGCLISGLSISARFAPDPLGNFHRRGIAVGPFNPFKGEGEIL